MRKRIYTVARSRDERRLCTGRMDKVQHTPTSAGVGVKRKKKDVGRKREKRKKRKREGNEGQLRCNETKSVAVV